MGKHLVLAGGGHAHMTVLLRLDEFTGKGHRVTVISPSAYHYYSGMGPGMLSGMYEPREIRFNIRKMAVERGASFIEDSAVRIDPGAKTILLASGGETPYDVASFNTGSRVPVECLSPERNGAIIPVKPIINLYRARLEILREIGRWGLHFPGRTPSAKVGVYAVRQNPVLLHNLMAALDGGSLQPFSHGGAYMLIMNMGDGRGILWKKNRVWNGRLAFLLKDFIDRRFMKTFQVSGERDEPDGGE